MSEPSDGRHDNSRDNPNSWSVISGALEAFITSASSRRQEERERTTNAEIGHAMRMLPEAIAKLAIHPEAHGLVARFLHALEGHIASHTFDSPTAAAIAEKPLNESITDLHDLSSWLREELHSQGKGHTVIITWHEVALVPLSQRVSPADMVVTLDHIQTGVATATKRAAQAMEEVLELQHPVRQAIGTATNITPPIRTDELIAIVLPDRSYTSADDHVRYMQRLLLDLAAHIDDKAKSFAREAQKSFGGSNPRAVANAAKGVLGYAALLIATCDRLSEIAVETPPYNTTKQ